MSELPIRIQLLLSLQRALWGEVHSQLRQASIEADEPAKIIRVRFEYDGEPSEFMRDSCSCAATEVIADFPPPWGLDEQCVAAPHPSKLFALADIAYRRWEPEHEA